MGTMAVKDHTWDTAGQAFHGQFRGQKRQSGTPKCLEEKKSGVVCIGRFIGRFVYREIYTRVFLYTGGVATQGEVRAISDQLPCPKIRLKLFN